MKNAKRLLTFVLSLSMVLSMCTAGSMFPTASVLAEGTETIANTDNLAKFNYVQVPISVKSDGVIVADEDGNYYYPMEKGNYTTEINPYVCKVVQGGATGGMIEFDNELGIYTMTNQTNPNATSGQYTAYNSQFQTYIQLLDPDTTGSLADLGGIIELEFDLKMNGYGTGTGNNARLCLLGLPTLQYVSNVHTDNVIFANNNTYFKSNENADKTKMHTDLDYGNNWINIRMRLDADKNIWYTYVTSENGKTYEASRQVQPIVKEYASDYDIAKAFRRGEHGIALGLYNSSNVNEDGFSLRNFMVKRYEYDDPTIEVEPYTTAKDIHDKYPDSEVVVEDANGNEVALTRELRTGMTATLDNGMVKNIKVKGQNYYNDFEGADAASPAADFSFWGTNSGSVTKTLDADAVKGKALKLTVPAATSVTLGSGYDDLRTSGKGAEIYNNNTVVLSYDLKTNGEGNVALYFSELNDKIANSEQDISSTLIPAAFLASREIATMSSQGIAAYAGYKGDKYKKYETDKWYNISLVMDVADTSCDLYIDGIKRMTDFDAGSDCDVDFKVNAWEQNFATCFKRLGIHLYTDGSNDECETWIDNISFHTFESKDAAEGAIAKKLTNISLAEDKGIVASENLTNAILLSDGTVADITYNNGATHKQEGNVIIVTSSDGSNVAKYYIADKSGIADMRFEQNGVRVAKPKAGKLTAVADYVDFWGEEKTKQKAMFFIIAAYKEGELKGLKISDKQKLYDSNHKEIEMTVPADCDEVRAFMWKQLDAEGFDISPYATALISEIAQ